MKKYKNITEEIGQLNEAIRYTDFPKAVKLVKKYLIKKLGKVYSYPMPETFSTSGEKEKVGIRLFIKGKKSIRLNWVKGRLNVSTGLDSIDYWDARIGFHDKPTSHVSFPKGISLVKALPLCVDLVKGKIMTGDEGVYIDESANHDGELLTEGRSAPKEEILQTINNVLEALSQDIQFEEQETNGGTQAYGVKWHQVRQAIRKIYKSLMVKRPGYGKKLFFDPNDVSKLDANKILKGVMGSAETVTFKVTPGKKEVQEEETVSAEEVDRLTYEEQLDALKSGMKLLLSNATNAIFVGGRGGTGKTQTVENMLSAAGKVEGEGYVKIAGSASPVGMYRVLWENRKNIILFDDSDSALENQEGRNIIKAATDTKKVRKLSWQKGGKAFYDPAEVPETDEDGDETNFESDRLPRYFEFTGKVIFISNLPLNKLDPDGALRTRGFIIDVDPTNEEIYDFMVKIANVIPLEVDFKLSKKARFEVVDILRERKSAPKTAHLRSLVRGLNVRAGIEKEGGSTKEWQDFVRRFA